MVAFLIFSLFCVSVSIKMGYPVYFNVYTLKIQQLLILGGYPQKVWFSGALEYFGLAFLFISIDSVEHIVTKI